MQDQIQKQILDAFFVVLRPIAKILLRYGIGFREFAEVAKSAFVDVATTEYGIRGRPTNISRVAVMTGLTRKEVRRLRNQLEHGEILVARKYTPLSQVIHRWGTEIDFTDANGQPAILPFSGKQRSFAELVRRYAGDIPPGAVRTELKRIGAVTQDEFGQLHLVRKDASYVGMPEEINMSLLHGAYALLENIAHNNDPARSDPEWVQMTAFAGAIKKNDLVRIRRICADRAKGEMDFYGDLFSGFEGPDEDASEPSGLSPVAMGIYYFEERNKNLVRLWETNWVGDE